MGIGYVASPHNFYEGRLKLGGFSEISPGIIVNADFKAGTAVEGAASNKMMYFVAQENETPIEYGINDLDQTVKVGEYLKLAPVVDGMEFKTTEVADEAVAGDYCKVGAKGDFEKSNAGEAGADFVVTQVDMIAATKMFTLAYKPQGTIA